jgi:hypothetical protein
LQFEASPGKYFTRPCLEKPFTKKGLVEWLKVKALRTNTSTEKQNKTKQTNKQKTALVRCEEA